MAPKPFGKGTDARRGDRERAELFVKRRNRSELFNWAGVNRPTLLAALAVAGQESVTVSFAPAIGGIGVTVRIYAGNKYDDGYAGTAEELNELLDLIIAEYQSSSEDARQAFIDGEVGRT